MRKRSDGAVRRRAASSRPLAPRRCYRGSMLRRASVAHLLALGLACGAARVDGDADAPICFAPGDVSAIPLADQTLVCLDTESHDPALSLDLDGWPALGLGGDCMTAQSVEVTAQCTVEALLGDAAPRTIRLGCVDAEQQAREVVVRVEADAFLFPVCEADLVTFSYRVTAASCFYVRSSFALTDAQGELLAASADGEDKISLGPLTVTLRADGGCPEESSTCVTRARAAFEVADPIASAIVHDGTRRVASLAHPYVVQATAVLVTDLRDACEDFSALRVALARTGL